MAIYTGFDNVNDKLTGSDDADTIRGLGGNDRLYGGAGRDSLYGGEGNDRLTGGDGIDFLDGGTGDDTYYGDHQDAFWEEDNGGTDTIYATGNFYLNNPFIENIILIDGIQAKGSPIDNYIEGNARDNVLDGSWGNDTLAGGAGNDTYYVDEAGDIVIERDGKGVDSIIASTSYVLGATVAVENISLSNYWGADLTGNGFDNSLTGNGAINTLTGLDGNDILDGKAGADIMVGGKGDDVYYADSLADLAYELKDEGHDEVFATSDYALGARSYIEDLTLEGLGDINGYGNSLDNRITGNSEHNLLAGKKGDDRLYGLRGDDTLKGGAGADRMYGGDGDDTYYADEVADIATELEAEGNDTLFASVSYSLSNTSYIDNLVLTGAGKLKGTGNNIANVMTGNTDNNVLKGMGGSDVLDGGKGADRLYGGRGNDTYYVDTAADLAQEVKGEGRDTVIAGVSYALSDTSYVEGLTLAGAENLSGTGNNIANILTGNGGRNSLSGRRGDDRLDGGIGDDTLTGGLGADTFIFLARSGIDTITDFDAGENDRIDVSACTRGKANIALLSQHGSDTWIDLGAGNVIKILGVSPTDAGLLSHITW